MRVGRRGFETSRAPSTASLSLAGLIATLSSGSAPATFDYYISPTGSDSNPGTQAQPWAITALNTKRALYSPSGIGKRIGLLSGTYNVGSLIGVDSDSPGLDMEGGTAGNSVVLQSVIPLGAKFDGGGVFGGKKGPLISHTQGTGRTHRGYIEIRDIEWTNFYCYTPLIFGKFTEPETLNGIVVAGNWVHDNTALGLAIDNIEWLTLNWCYGAIIENNLGEDLIGHTAESSDHLAFILQWQGAGNIIRYNTAINAGNVFYGKEINAQGTLVYGNYSDTGMYTSSAYGIQDCAGYPTGGLTQTTRWYNNIIRSSGVGLAAFATLNELHGFSTPIEIFNNTIDMTSTAGGSLESALCVIGEASAGRVATVYNNIFTGSASVDNKAICTSPQTPLLWDYNYTPTSYTFALRNNGNGGGTISTHTTVAAFSAASLANGGIAIDANGKQGSSPSFTGSGALADAYKLAGGSICKNAGRIGGTSGGAITDFGAWGGLLAPSTIGATFRGKY